MTFSDLDLRNLDAVDRVALKIALLISQGWVRDARSDHTLMFSPEGDRTFNMMTEEMTG